MEACDQTERVKKAISRFADKKRVLNILSNKKEIRKADLSKSKIPAISALFLKPNLSH